MITVTGAVSVSKRPRIKCKNHKVAVSRRHNRKIKVSYVDSQIESIADDIIKHIKSSPNLAGKKISFLWTNGTKNEAQQLASLIERCDKSQNVQVLENLQKGKEMEEMVIKSLRAYDCEHGSLFRNIPDKDLWYEMFKPIIENSKIRENDRRDDRLSDILEKHDSEHLKELQNNLRHKTAIMIPSGYEDLYKLKRSLEKYQRDISKDYADSISDDFVILVRKEHERIGTANMAELRTIYRKRHSKESNIVRKHFIDMEIAI